MSNKAVALSRAALYRKGSSVSRPPNKDTRRALKTALRQFRQILKSLDIKTLRIKDVSDLYKVNVSLAALAKAEIELERGEVERAGLKEEARAEIFARIRHEFVKYPELCDQVMQVIAQTPMDEPKQLE